MAISLQDIPDSYNDLNEVIVHGGFLHSNTWYHGTSSALISSIVEHGLVGGGDSSMNLAIEQTMSTIGNKHFATSEEPVFLTPSKAIAYYFASQKTKDRNKRFGSNDTATVIEINLDEKLNTNVRPDVGAKAFLLLKDGESYLELIHSAFAQKKIALQDLDLMSLERDRFLTTLGLAYIDQALPSQCLKELV